MSRVRISTTIQEDLLAKAKQKAADEGLDGANAVIEEALRIYFSNHTVQVWEKPLNGGWVKKMVVRPNKVTIETIRCRKVKERFNPVHYSAEVLEGKGWKRTWKMKQL